MPKGQAMMPLDEAMAWILADVNASQALESVPLDQALGRVLAAEVRAAIDVPPWDNSAMDGYAVRSADVVREGASLRVSQRIAAGSNGVALEPGTAARIFTGAPLPAAADAVIMQENTSRQGDVVNCLQGVVAGDNVRLRAQDIASGDSVLRRGKRLSPQDLGVLASVGVAQVSVRSALRVGIFSTGDELQEPGVALQANQIYNSNRYMLVGLLQAIGMQWHDYGIVPDSRQATEEVLHRAAAECDVLLSSGGVSVGEEDHVRSAVAALGELNVWKLAIKPGKPMAYGRVCGVPFFGLPGNPAATFVTFGLVVKPYLRSMLGELHQGPTVVSIAAGFCWETAGHRREYLRAKLCRNECDELSVNLFGNQSSGILSLVSEADCLVVMPIGGTCQPGDPVDVITMVDWLG
jgi:molybdopterin molybdotransferase